MFFTSPQDVGRQINDGRKLICVLLFSPAGKNSATQIGLWFCCLFVCRIFLLGGCLFTGFSQLFFGRLSLSNGSVAAMKLTAPRQRRGLDMDLCFSWVLLSFRVRGWRLSGGVENAFPPFFPYPRGHFSRVVKGLGDPSLPFLPLLVFVPRVGVFCFCPWCSGSSNGVGNTGTLSQRRVPGCQNFRWPDSKTGCPIKSGVPSYAHGVPVIKRRYGWVFRVPPYLIASNVNILAQQHA